MGIFDFFKKIFSESKKPELIREKTNFSNIEEIIKKKINETNEKEEKVISSIKEKIATFAKELKDKIKIVNEVDVEAKEKNDKIKSAVYEGRKKYVEFLERFIENIETLKETNLEEIMEDINLAFLRFNENSSKSYERATIRIGKEMGSIKETLKNLSSEIISIFSENKEIVSISKKLSLIKLKLNEIKDTNEKIEKINEEILGISNKIPEKEIEIKDILENISKIKASSDYLENLEKERLVQLEEKEVEKEIYSLKELIDFKALLNFFHIFEDKMTIVKLYKEDFQKELKNDKGIRLLKLLNESKLNTEKIEDKINKIQNKIREIEIEKTDIRKDETQILALEIEKIKEEIKNLANEKEWADKKNEKLKISKSENLKIIKDELNIMGVDLEED
jgi:hypothetical protein